MNAGSPGKIGLGGLLVLAALAAGVALVFFLGGNEADDVMTRLEAGGPIRIGYANEEPYGYLDVGSGEVTGEAPEIARVILERLGVEVIESEVARFGELIPALKAGQLDVIAAGMYITPARCKEILFSEPTYRIGEAFIVRAGNPLALHAYEDVAAHRTARVGVMGGSEEHTYAKVLGVPEDRIIVFEDYQTALVGLETDRVDAIGATYLTAKVLLRKADNAAFERATPFREPVIDGEPAAGFGAFGFRLSDPALRDAFNRELEAFIGSPEHLELVKPFGFSEETLPGDVTAADLCDG